MRTPTEHIKTLQRRIDFLKAREHKNSYDAAEIGSLEWAIVNLKPQHWSDCAVHSEPAYPAGECDCGGYNGTGTITIVRQWVGLTDEEKIPLAKHFRAADIDVFDMMEEIEAKLKENNT